jgi:threonine synthase
MALSLCRVNTMNTDRFPSSGTVHLRCSEPACGATADVADGVLRCARCGELLEVVVAPAAADPAALRDLWWSRRLSHDPRDTSGVWRFREFLPPYPADAIVTLHEGNTPLIEAPRSAAMAGVRRLSFKHLGWNPTGSFKDAGMTVGVTQAKHGGATRVACASTGNTAASMAAYAARGGIAARAYLPKGAVSAAKLAQTFDYGAEVVEVDGNFDTALSRMLSGASRDEYFLNSINPFRLEGQKTALFGVLEQLGWRPPDFVVLPGGNLGNVSAFGKGLEELVAAGLLKQPPRLVVVQAEGANPFVRLWRSGGAALVPIEHPQTAATAIRIGAPCSWKKALRALRFTEGTAVDVSEDEIADAKAAIGREGIGCEPASATTLAAVRKLAAGGVMSRESSVVAILTGHVLKDPDFITRRLAGDRHGQ